MSFGQIFGIKANPRTLIVRAVAKAAGLDVKLVEITFPVSEDYRKINPLGKIPAFVGSDGFVLTECLAIAFYFASQNANTTLLGKTKEDYASILKWASLSNSDLISTMSKWYLPYLGREPYNKKVIDAAIQGTKVILSVFERQLLHNTFLVTEQLTLADIVAACILGRGYQVIFDPEIRASFPNITRWYETVANQLFYKEIAGEVKYIDEAPKYIPPKKEEKKKEAPKAAPKAEKKPATENDDDEDIVPAEPKQKHPLDLLPQTSMILDDWKRKYSNEDTRTVALPWFWDNYKPEEYSLWKVDYKYNEELTLTFMSSNLIGGFHNRLEASRKHIFGAMSVYGEPSSSILSGAYIVRGQEYLPAFDVAPDWESFTFTKLDSSNPEDRAFVEDQWSWDKDYQGMKWAAGKVLKA